jgi:hypothetical protein
VNALFSLCRLHFIRAAIWFVCGCWMMLWWYDKPGRELTWDDNGYLFFAAFWIGLGALGTFVRWRKKQQAMQTIPTMPTWTTPADAEIELMVPAQQILELDKSEYRSIQ